jgi:hypothetical protein
MPNEMNVELLQRVKAKILAEPNRLSLDVWMLAPSRRTDTGAFEDEPCGTVGCIAGWICALGTDQQIHERDIYNTACILLGLPKMTATRLFFREEWPKDLREAYCHATKAEVTAQAIDLFIERGGEWQNYDVSCNKLD